jgi:pyruvate dehydrogenase E2 component (dihydrolipoamide acetyltransferase)
MAVEVVMPKQGNSVEACIILEWKVAVGDTVSVGDVVCEAETDKSTIEVESSADGTVLALIYEVGDEVPVMSPMMVVGEKGEKVDLSSMKTEEKKEEVVEEKGEEKVESKVVQTATVEPTVHEGTILASPRAKHTAQKQGVSLSSLSASGPKGRIIERDVLEFSAKYPSISPAAKEAIVNGEGFAPAQGSGIGGRILLKDLLKNQEAGVMPSADSASPLSFPGNVKEIPVKGVRKVTAQRMGESLSTTAQFTMTSYADASQLLSLRKKFKASAPELQLQGITLNDMVMFAVSKTLQQFPALNAHYLGDKIVEFEHVHLGCAVDTPKGLLVPVVPFASLRSLSELSAEAKRLAQKAIDGKAQMEELSGSTFTVTNIGALGIDTFTPVINIPEVAILGVGGISLRPVGKGGDDVSFVPHIALSLTVNHMAVDGAPGARFLQALVKNIAAIDLMLAL